MVCEMVMQYLAHLCIAGLASVVGESKVKCCSATTMEVRAVTSLDMGRLAATTPRQLVRQCLCLHVQRCQQTPMFMWPEGCTLCRHAGSSSRRETQHSCARSSTTYSCALNALSRGSAPECDGQVLELESRHCRTVARGLLVTNNQLLPLL